MKNGAVKYYFPSEKFDRNIIGTQAVSISGAREKAIEDLAVNSAVAAVPFGREIFASIFNRDSKGMMDDKTIRYRGNYDAKDQDVINARASFIGASALDDMGTALVAGNYIVVADFYNFHTYTDDKGKVTYYVNVKEHAYKIDIPDGAMDTFFNDCWIYDNDSESVRKQKMQAFSKFNLAMTPVATGSGSGSGSNYQEAVNSGIASAFEALERKVPDWNVATSIYPLL